MFYVGASAFIATVVGFGFGGVIALFLKEIQQKVSTINALCTGFILGLVFLEITPESIDLGGWSIFIIGSLLGIFSFVKIHKLSHIVTPTTKNLQRDRLIKTGLLLAISITIHNFPLGVAFGSSQNLDISESILQTLILHNIPEGIAMFIPLFLAGLRFSVFVLITCIVSLPVGFGAIVGSLIGMKYPILWALIINFSLGIIVIVTFKEIFIEAVKQSSFGHALFFVVIGIFVIWGYLTFL